MKAMADFEFRGRSGSDDYGSRPRRGISPAVSAVVPAHDEAESLPLLIERLEVALDATDGAFEVIVVDDRSRDETFDVLLALRASRPWLRIIRFSRNFGKEVALAAGLRAARGDVVIQLDADLQHPPELIATLLDGWRQGADIVYAARDRAAEKGGLRDVASRAFYRLFDRIAEVRLMPGSGDFALFDRRVVDVLNAMPERNRFGKGLYAWVGFERRAVPYLPDARQAGRSRFRPLGLARLALAGITSFSILPLRVWSTIGAMISFLAFLGGALILGETLVWGGTVPGYPSLMVAVVFLGGIQLMTLGIIGEYLGQVYMEVKRRPLYVIDEAVGFEEDMADAFAPGHRYERARP